jgi:opacity protein-like surface antigen
MKKLLFLLSLILVSGASALMAADAPSYGFYATTGFGFANNLRMADYMNARSDAYETALNTHATKKEPMFCYGFDLEARKFMKNIVYGISIGYLSTTKGSREITSGAVIYNEELTLKAMSLRGSVYYKIDLDSGNRVLLGGGLGYYYGTMESTINRNFSTNYHKKDSTWTIGWHSGIEYDIVFGNFNLCFGATSRFVEFYKFKVQENNSDDLSGGFTGLNLSVGAGYTL